MLKTQHTIYLSNIFLKYQQSEIKSEKQKKYLNILINGIFNNEIKENKSDKELIEKYNITTYTPIYNKYDIIFIDIDDVKNINQILKCFDKYNKENENVKKIIKFITVILINIDKITFISDSIYHLLTFINKYNMTHINDIKTFLINEHYKIMNDIINKSTLFKNVKIKQIIYGLIYSIYWSIRNYENKNDYQPLIDKIVNYVYFKIINIDNIIDNDIDYFMILNNEHIYTINDKYSNINYKKYKKKELLKK